MPFDQPPQLASVPAITARHSYISTLNSPQPLTSSDRTINPLSLPSHTVVSRSTNGPRSSCRLSLTLPLEHDLPRPTRVRIHTHIALFLSPAPRCYTPAKYTTPQEGTSLGGQKSTQPPYSAVKMGGSHNHKSVLNLVTAAHSRFHYLTTASTA